MELFIGDIILVHGDCFISNEIKEVENSIYSHCACIVKENVIIEAGFFKVRYNVLDEYKNQADIYRYEGLNNFERVQIANYLADQLNCHYDYKLLIYEWIRYKLGIALPFWFKDTNSVICSELISDAYRSIRLDLCPNIKYPSPRDISESKLIRRVCSL